MKKNCHSCEHVWIRYDGPQCALITADWGHPVTEWIRTWGSPVPMRCPDWADNCPGWEVSDFEIKKAGRRALKEAE